MNTGTKILLTGAAIATGAALLVAKTASNLKALSYKALYIKREKQTGLLDNLLGTKLLLTIQVINPNAQAVNLRSFVADVIVNKSIVGRINLTQELPLAGNENTIIKDIPFAIQNFDAIKQFILTASGKGSTVLTISGTLKADGFTLPVNTSFDLKNLSA